MPEFCHVEVAQIVVICAIAEGTWDVHVSAEFHYISLFYILVTEICLVLQQLL